MLCCTGPSLPEALKLLAPLANLEELSLGGNKLGGAITADVAAFNNLKKLNLCRMGLNGKPFSTRTERFNFLDQNCVASGCVPKELANLTNLVNLSLYGNQLRVPDGAPIDSAGDMLYDNREEVAAFQACLS